MRKHVKDALIAQLTPAWWETRAIGRMRDGDRQCVLGVLADNCGSLLSGDCSGVPLMPLAHLNDSGTYDQLLAAVNAIPEEA